MLRNVILVGLGSMVGGVARYLISLQIAERYVSNFPWGTFTVNVLGCFAVGLVYGSAERYGWFTPDIRLLMAVGFCGGFTTFSSFAFENVGLAQNRDLLTLMAYTTASIVLGVGSTYAGLWLSRP